MSTASTTTTADSTSGPTCSPPMPGVVLAGTVTEGRDAIQEYMMPMQAAGGPCMHVTTNSLVDVDGDTATATTDYLFVRPTTDGLAIIAAGRYHDQPGPRRGAVAVPGALDHHAAGGGRGLEWLTSASIRGTAAVSPAVLRREVPFAIDRPGFVPVERYYDPRFAALERDHLWPRVWQMACRLEEIPSAGDYVEYTIERPVDPRGAPRRGNGPGLPQRLSPPGHPVGQGDRHLPRRSDRVPVPRVALGHRREELVRLRTPRLRPRPVGPG